MPDYGLSPQGFKRKRYADVIDSMEDRAKDKFGENVNLSPASPLGLFIKVTAWSISLVWSLAEDVYNSAYPDTAEGVSLRNVGKFIGITAQESEAATGEVTLTGTIGYIVSEGFGVETEGGIQFVTTADVEFSGSTVIAPIEALVEGSAGNVPPGTITVITNPVEEVTDVTNADATTGGRDDETDPEFRNRYERSVAKAGSSTAPSIEATLLDVSGVIDALIRTNETMDDPDADGIPAKSIAPIVYGGDDTDIAEAIFGVKAGGIQSFGDTNITVTDSRGQDNIIGFTRPTPVEVNTIAELLVDSNYPTDGNDQVQAEIENYYEELRLGQDVIYVRVIKRIQRIPGVIDIPNLKIGVTTPPTGEVNISVDATEVAIPGVVGVTSS